MKSLRTISRRAHRASGFSLLEMAMVMAILIMMGSITFMSLQPVLKQNRVNNAYNTSLAAFRQARDNAIAQRTSYVVTFNDTANPPTVTVAPTFSGFQGVLPSATYPLPPNVKFSNEAGIPTSSSYTPDGFGTGAKAVDFGYTPTGGTGGQKSVYFCPDGSAQDAAGGAGQCMGNFSSGVLYIARPGELMSSRALTVWGATGRIRGWRLYDNGSGGTAWKRQ